MKERTEVQESKRTIKKEFRGKGRFGRCSGNFRDWRSSENRKCSGKLRGLRVVGVGDQNNDQEGLQRKGEVWEVVFREFQGLEEFWE